jgi:small Trp-rich protein
MRKRFADGWCAAFTRANLEGEPDVYLLGLGIVLLILKWLAIGPAADWSWWIVIAPFIAAALWWEWADWSGYTKRKAMEKDDQQRLDRINRQRDALNQKRRSAPPRGR